MIKNDEQLVKSERHLENLKRSRELYLKQFENPECELDIEMRFAIVHIHDQLIGALTHEIFAYLRWPPPTASGSLLDQAPANPRQP